MIDLHFWHIDKSFLLKIFYLTLQIEKSGEIWLHLGANRIAMIDLIFGILTTPFLFEKLLFNSFKFKKVARLVASGCANRIAMIDLIFCILTTPSFLKNYYLTPPNLKSGESGCIWVCKWDTP